MTQIAARIPDPALPGAELVSAGIADLQSGVESPEAMMVAEAAPRLRSLGLDVPGGGPALAGHRLFELLQETEGAGAHSRYNAYFGRMVSFCRAAASTGSGLATSDLTSGDASTG